MSLFEGDRYKQISVYSTADKINSIEIETDLGAKLCLGVPSNAGDEQFVLFLKNKNDPLQFFGFEGFSTLGNLQGFRTIAYSRKEYDVQIVQNAELETTVSEMESTLVIERAKVAPLEE